MADSPCLHCLNHCSDDAYAHQEVIYNRIYRKLAKASTEQLITIANILQVSLLRKEVMTHEKEYLSDLYQIVERMYARVFVCL